MSQPQPRPFIAIIIAIGMAVLIVWAFGAARAHSQYEHWCCQGGRDCAPYPEASYTSAPDGGWLVTPAPGAPVVHFKPAAYRTSEDGMVHLCIYRGEARCLYLPPRT